MSEKYAIIFSREYLTQNRCYIIAIILFIFQITTIIEG